MEGLGAGLGHGAAGGIGQFGARDEGLQHVQLGPPHPFADGAHGVRVVPGFDHRGAEFVGLGSRLDQPDGFGQRGAVVTGGEPTLNPGVFQVVEKLREWGFAIKLDTNGSRPRVLEKLLPLVDYVAMDVKFAPADYPARAGFADVAALTESIRLIREQAKAYEFRTTVIEAWHDADAMRAIGEWVRGAKLHVLQAFVPRAELPDPACRDKPETRTEILHAYADLLRPYVDRVEIRGEF